MKKKLRDIWEITKRTFKDYSTRNAGTDAAALAYSAIFSIPGLLIIVIWTAGIFLGEEAARGEVSRVLGDLMGAEVGKTIEELILKSMVDKDDWFMKIIGVAALVFGATNFFFQLQKSLNKMWEVRPAPKQAWYRFLLDRANSLGMILTIGFLLLVTMVISSMIGLLNNYIVQWFHLDTLFWVNLANFVIGLIITTVLFALMFKILPDADIEWRSVWLGAFVTSLLFAVGKFALTLYFDNFKPSSSFGAAGTVVLLMMWINYTCQLIFLGAEFTKVSARYYGHKIEPSPHAESVPQINTPEEADEFIREKVMKRVAPDTKTHHDAMI